MTAGLFEYHVRVSPRAKHPRLKVTLRKGLEVVVPRGFDDDLIPGILNKKRGWIRTAQEKIDQQARFVKPEADVILPDHILLSAVGERWRAQYRPAQTKWAAVYEEGDGRLIIRGDIQSKAACRAALKRWLGRKGKRTLVPWLHKVSEETELPFKRTFIKCQRTRWASCSRHGSISLNLKLLFLPTHLVRYVFIHELCHTIHMDHSRRYWALLAAKAPGYMALDEELRVAWRGVPSWVG